MSKLNLYQTVGFKSGLLNIALSTGSRAKQRARGDVFSLNHGTRVPHSLIKLPSVFIEQRVHDSIITVYLTRYRSETTTARSAECEHSTLLRKTPFCRFNETTAIFIDNFKKNSLKLRRGK